MKTSHAIIVILIVLLLTGLVLVSLRSNDDVAYTPPEEENVLPVTGCYVATTGGDVYTLHIISQEGEIVSGTLDFNNFQKDSSHGTLVGTYRNSILLGDYSFTSEGTDSVMQIVFKRVGDNFVRGYGPLDTTGTRFSDLSQITYDSSNTLFLFKSASCTS